MGMSSYVEGFVPPDAKFKKMKAAFDACQEAGIEVPSEVWEFFDHEPPNAAGVSINIDRFVTEVSPRDTADGYEIDLEALAKNMPHVKKIQFVNSY